MKCLISRAVCAAVLLCLALPSRAAFLAGDLVYVPVVAFGEGANASVWRSDVFITNTDDAEIDVAIAYLPSGNRVNTVRFTDRSDWLGGREADGFGHLDDSLAAIPPGGSVRLENIVGTWWEEVVGVGGNGALVVFAYEADTLENDGSRVFANAVVSSRTYNETTLFEPDPDTEGEFVEVDATYGQLIPGVPWYDLVYAEEATEERDLSYEILVGGSGNEALRYNLGLLNTSDPLTELTVLLQPFKPDGSPFLTAEGDEIESFIVLPPLAHFQYFRVLTSGLFGLDPEEEDLSNVTIRVSIEFWRSSAATPVPALTSYGSLVDNSSNDAATVLPSFGESYPLECVWFDDGSGGEGGAKSATVRRPIEIPSR